MTTLILYKIIDIEPSRFKVTPRIHLFSKVLLYIRYIKYWVTENVHFLVDTFWDTQSDKTKNSFTFMDVQITNEGGQDNEFPECFLPIVFPSYGLTNLNNVTDLCIYYSLH